MLKVGLIGAGTIGSVHAAAYDGIRGAALAGIADARLEAAQSLARTAGVAAYSSFEALIEAEKPDVVDICLPTHLHKEYTLKAAVQGLHVLCENPIALSADEAKAMIEACREAGVKLMIGQVVRFSPDYVRVRDLVLAGKAGRIGTVRMMREGGLPNGAEGGYHKFGNSGGVVLELALHDLDWLRWTFGDVERVYAKRSQKSVAAHQTGDHCFLSLRMKIGVIAHVSGSWAHPNGFFTFLEVAGREGVLYTAYDEKSMPIRNRVLTDSGVVTTGESPLGVSPYRSEIQHFIDCVANDTTPEVSGEEALESLKIALVALQSAESGKAVTL